jgi:hypothetical protein
VATITIARSAARDVADPRDPLTELHLDFKPAVSEMIDAIAHGRCDELAVFGTRGEGKTWGALGSMIAHAVEHARRGAALPTRWIGFTDTFESHKNKTLESLLAPTWKGSWQLADQGHLATFTFLGVPFVRLTLFGVDSPRDANRVRTECHGVWCEEPAPAAELWGGIGQDAWEIALTSTRLPTHAPAALLTANYPDEDHWTWKRFVGEPRPGTAVIRIPVGERASVADRAKWAAAISDPVLRRRLLEGEPGLIILGDPVAVGYRAAQHVAAAPLPLLRGELWMGHDSGPNAHTHATLVAQTAQGQVRIFAALVSQYAGLKQHLEQVVLPWLEKRAPWALEPGGEDWLYHRYDPTMNTGEGGDIDHSPLSRLRESLGGHFMPGSVSWPARIGPVLTLFQSATNGLPALAIDPGPDTEPLRKALAGRWHYARMANGLVARDLPAKPNHPWEDVGDSFCYLVGGLAPRRVAAPVRPRPPRQYGRLLGQLGR